MKWIIRGIIPQLAISHSDFPLSGAYTKLWWISARFRKVIRIISFIGIVSIIIHQFLLILSIPLPSGWWWNSARYVPWSSQYIPKRSGWFSQKMGRIQPGGLWLIPNLGWLLDSFRFVLCKINRLTMVPWSIPSRWMVYLPTILSTFFSTWAAWPKPLLVDDQFGDCTTLYILGITIIQEGNSYKPTRIQWNEKGILNTAHITMEKHHYWWVNQLLMSVGIYMIHMMLINMVQ